MCTNQKKKKKINKIENYYFEATNNSRTPQIPEIHVINHLVIQSHILVFVHVDVRRQAWWMPKPWALASATTWFLTPDSISTDSLHHFCSLSAHLKVVYFDFSLFLLQLGFTLHGQLHWLKKSLQFQLILT